MEHFPDVKHFTLACVNSKALSDLHKKYKKMKFNYVTEVETDTLPSGRTYHTPDGSFPSITTILGKTANNVWLQNGKKKLEKRKQLVSQKATDRGTAVHEFAEQFFNGDDIYSDLSQAPRDVIQMTKDLIRIAQTGVEEVWGQEQVLWSKKYRYAGRTIW